MADPRFDFILVKLNDGADPAAAEAHLVKELGAKPEKLRTVFAHLKEKGPVAIEKAVNGERLAQLKGIWEAAGVATTSKQSLVILEGLAAEPGKAVFKCPACAHEQEPAPEPQQCQKCGVFAHKFLEQQKKQELYLREKEKLERINDFRRQKEEQDAKAAAEAAELEAIRKRLEEEMGLKKEGRFGWLTGSGPGSTAARASLGGAVLAVLLIAGWYGRDLIAPGGVTQEDLAKHQAAQSKQNATQMQNMVGQLIQGSKKMAQTSGAAAQFQQALFAQGDKDLELQEHLQSVQSGGASALDAQIDGDRAEGLSSAARTFADSGGSVDDAEKALSASMQSAKKVKDVPQRGEAVSVVASSQVEVFTQDAREKAAAGNWRAADKSFSKALSAASEITHKPDLVKMRGSVAKARADTGDYGGSTLLFLDAMKAAEELPDPRMRAVALADVARQIAQTTNEMEGAAERGFEKALAVTATMKAEADRAYAVNEIVLRQVQAASDVVAYLITTDVAAKQVPPLLERAGKDVERITDALLLAQALGAHARVMAEFEGDTARVKALTDRLAKLPEAIAQPARERVAAAAARGRVETAAAAAKFIASQGEKAKAKQAFLAALKSTNTIATASTDPVIRSEVAKQRTEALGTLARYMRASGDKQAASKVFLLALESAGPGQAPKVVSWMVLAERRG